MQTELMKDLFTDNQYTFEYELYQSYSRFDVYNVYKVYKKSNQKVFLYRTTKERHDFGKRLSDSQDLLNELNRRMGYHFGKSKKKI